MQASDTENGEMTLGAGLMGREVRSKARGLLLADA